ncbi:DUF3775 domain-containing protein [Bacillus sp. XT-2]|uniref:DUF3775 domain-containing protein n=1 Tax=Bacillus sp. XT-2 TaxID=2856852 RepID=UPI0021E12C89|nr:DUF3775 domain-containing protein [Bacillus sp. XT-2]MCV0023409.1 DUF3775 domain-containing protein [Bacillus sp. XT-2]MCV0025696.1 DUF3775 domain-containing protein [Bacillus sp. XT-2]
MTITIYSLLDDKLPLIKNVIRISEEREKSTQDYKEKEVELYRLLGRIDFEDLKTIQTIMYIGRELNGDVYNSTLDSFMSMRNSLGDNPNNKDNDAYSIATKRPLHKYLKNGLLRLGFLEFE